MTVLGARIKVHLLSPIILVLSFVFTDAKTLFPSLLALSLHELSHLMCAFYLGAKIDEIELMPFGAAVRLYELWQISPGKLMLIALSGPFANLFISASLSLFLFFFPFLARQITPHIYSGIALGLLNLLPALPLDGGRFLSAILALRIKRSKAVGIGILLGRVLGAFLLLSAAYGFLKTRTVSLLPILASVYLFASGSQEKRYAEGATLRMLCMNPSPPPVQRAGIIVAKDSATIFEAVRAVRPGEESLFAITDDSGEILSLLPLQRVLPALSQNAQSTMDVFTKP